MNCTGSYRRNCYIIVYVKHKKCMLYFRISSFIAGAVADAVAVPSCGDTRAAYFVVLSVPASQAHSSAHTIFISLKKKPCPTIS